MDNDKGKFEITEMFMAQACRDRRFFGTIQRGFDSDGIPVVYGKITVQDGFVCASAATQEELGKRLDELVKMVLDEGLHDDAGKSIQFAGTTIIQN